MEENRIMMGDSYKYSHTIQYPPNTVSMYDYAEARSSKVYDKTVFFGLQYILKRYFTKPITHDELVEAEMYAKAHGIPFNRRGWAYIVNDLKGQLPVRIKAIPEGTVMPTNMPLFTIESTDAQVYWIVSWLETTLMKVWYTSNIATRSYFVKQLLMKYAEKTQDNAFVDYQYHNFGYRGSTTEEAGAIGGVAHLTQFMGTDNFQSLKYAKEFYNVEDINTIGHSIPATEHSSTTAWGREDEYRMVMNHLENNKGAPIIAAVGDSYDYFNFVETVTSGDFKDKIESMDYPTFVIRPDSGSPAEIIPKTLDILEKNGVKFTVKKGYIVLDKYRIIWGDGINMEAMETMLDILVERGYSSENIAFGSGGWLMQQHDRDTQGWAVKCSSITLEEEGPSIFDPESSIGIQYVERDVFKDPITAPNKQSKKGKVTTFYNKENDTYQVSTVNDTEILTHGYVEALEVVYENGKMIKEYALDEVRANSQRS